MRLRAIALTSVGVVALGAVTVTFSPIGTAASSSASVQEPFPPALVDGVARDLRLTKDQARQTLVAQQAARDVRDRLPDAVVKRAAGIWFDERSGQLTVAVTDDATADAARAAGARPARVARSKAQLDGIVDRVKAIAAANPPGLNGYGVDEVANDVLVRVNRTKASDQLRRALRALDGVRVEESDTSPVQQSGEVNPGDGWWPGSESPCSAGVGATDANGVRYMVTAGHCTNDVNQAAYGQSGQQNRLGTVNPGGGKSVNGREGDMGLVSVTEPGWTLSASVNTWGQPAVTVTGSRDAIVGETVCHSGNTAPNWECGRVTKLNHTMNYGSVVVEGLTVTTSCSQGGDSGGVWLAGDKAVGLHEGAINGNNCPSGDNAVFQPLDEALAKWNLTLFTGGGGGGDTQAPTAPTNPRSTGVTTSSVSLAWDAATDNVGVTGYDVFNGTVLATSTTGTSATVTGLAADTAYTFTVKARDAAGNTSAASAPVAARTSTGGGGGGRTFANGTDAAIRDFQVTISKITSTAPGQAASPVTVAVTASHTCQQDLQITLVAPSGRYHTLQNYGGDGWSCSAFPGTRTFTVTPASGESASGVWTLRIGDNGPGDTGVLDAWSIIV